MVERWTGDAIVFFDGDVTNFGRKDGGRMNGGDINCALLFFQWQRDDEGTMDGRRYCIF